MENQTWMKMYFLLKMGMFQRHVFSAGFKSTNSISQTPPTSISLCVDSATSGNLEKTPTPLKINMSPEKGPFQKETGLPTGDMLIFAGVPLPTKI